MTEEEEFNNPDYNNPNSIYYRKKLKSGVFDNFPYLGNLKERQRENGDGFLIGYACFTDILNIPEEYLVLRSNNKKYVKFIINKYINGPNKHGETHSLAVDTFKFNKEN